MKERLDSSDRKILEALQKEGRTTNADLARQVGLSPPSMLQRVRRLEQKGFITGYQAELDPEKLGYSIVVFAMVSLSLHQEQPIENFLEAIGPVPEVIDCYHVSGDYDFLLKIVAKDMHDYERVLRDHLSRVRAIGKIHSCFVLRANKKNAELPIPENENG